MLFSRVASFFGVFLTVGAFALAGPAEKRSSAASVQTVLTTLQSSTNSILPQINALSTNGKASDSTALPLINELVSALNTAQSSLAVVNAGGSLLEKRQSTDEVATLVAGIVSDITLSLNGIVGVLPILDSILVDVDVALSEVLTGVEIAVDGVLTLVAGLLGGVVGILESLTLGLVLGLLGL
ncbi:hypothetical protein M0805_008057 [Coniferiporia weirii]|nr:hypothetical protein M0805_008057 [Coniferiporia weirii]